MRGLDIIKEYLIITIGVIIAAFGVYFFLVPSGLTIGSVSGLGMVLEKVLPFKLSEITFVLNAVLLVVGFIFIGRDFGDNTATPMPTIAIALPSSTRKYLLMILPRISNPPEDALQLNIIA